MPELYIWAKRLWRHEFNGAASVMQNTLWWRLETVGGILGTWAVVQLKAHIEVCGNPCKSVQAWRPLAYYLLSEPDPQRQELVALQGAKTRTPHG